MSDSQPKTWPFIILLMGLMTLNACSGTKGEAKYPTGNRETADQGDIYAEETGIFGEDGLQLLGDDKKQTDNNPLAVNAFLWRAALETVSFMPLASADPFGGVIITDWYENPDKPNSRHKLNVFITDKQLRASALKVSMFKQERASSNGAWKDAKVSAEDTTKVENAILAKARELRVKKLDQE